MASMQRTSRASSRAIRSLLHQSQRSLATHAAASSSSSSGSSSSEPSSSTSSSSWSPRLAPGVSPAYDEALHFISSHQASLKRRITELQSSSASTSPESAAVIESLTVASQINDPQVRWAFENTAEDDLDLKSPVVRHLRERAWRKCGSLDKLIERLRDQYVLPDSVASIVPTVDLQLILGSPTGPGVSDHTPQGSTPAPSGDVLPGVLIDQRHLVEQPTLRLTSFNSGESKKYTLLMVDLDRPDEEGKLVTHAHWLVTDISLSASQPRLLTPGSLLGGQAALPYVAPYPAKGSAKHRYVTLLAEQTTSSSPAAPAKRSNFELRDYLSTNGLEPVGIHFFRSEWTEGSKESISQVWKSLQGEEEGKEEVWGTLGRRERKRRQEVW